MYLFFLIGIISTSGVVSFEEDINLIINGDNADIKDYPFMAGIYYFGKVTCGGSIINKNWILTAAHCLYDVSTGSKRDLKQFSVEVGNSIHHRGTMAYISSSKIHPNFKFKTRANDIALLKLDSSLVFTSNVQPVTLPHSHQLVNTGTIGTILGWGLLKEGGSPSTFLKKAELPVIDLDQCASIYKGEKIAIGLSNVCAMAPGGGKGQCTGDSGGPLIVKKNEEWVQVGVVSFSGKPCANSFHPGVFTSVSYYIDWINYVIL